MLEHTNLFSTLYAQENDQFFYCFILIDHIEFYNCELNPEFVAAVDMLRKNKTTIRKLKQFQK